MCKVVSLLYLYELIEPILKPMTQGLLLFLLTEEEMSHVKTNVPKVCQLVSPRVGPEAKQSDSRTCAPELLC